MSTASSWSTAPSTWQGRASGPCGGSATRGSGGRPIPYGSHNARPFREGVLLNHTASDRIAFLDRRGRIVYSYPLANYDERALVHTGLSRDMARPAFGRGLAVVSDRLFVGGSSPATATAYRWNYPRSFDPSTSRWTFGTRCTVSRCGRSISDRSSPLPLPPKESGGGATPYSVEPGIRSPHEIGREQACSGRYRIERLDQRGCLVAHRREPRFPDPAEVATAPPFAHRGPQRRPPPLERLRRDRVVSNGPRGVAHAGPRSTNGTPSTWRGRTIARGTRIAPARRRDPPRRGPRT